MITIQQLHIFGFGKHTNKIIPLDKGMNIFFGYNEAGKTTIQQFILQILFGFPSKNSVLAKYEPKESSRFGGKIQLFHPKYGQCTVERVKGKGGGDVTVWLSDGTVGRDELLGKLLFGYSRAAFEAIFAFSLHELQGIERMSEEELSRILLASGTTGVDQLTKIERKLEKEIGELYKKSGKNPYINQKIEQLKESERDIHRHQLKIASYESELSRLKIVESLLEEKQSQKQLLQNDWQTFMLLKQALPLLKEKHFLEDDISTYNVKYFPTDGIRRFEQLKDRFVDLEATIQQLEWQKQNLEERLATHLDLEHYMGLQQLAEKESEWHHLQAALKTLHEEQILLKAELDNHYRLLGIHQIFEKESIATQNVSLQEEERFQVLLDRLEQLEERQKIQLHTAERVRDELDETEQRLQQLQNEQPTEAERMMVEQLPMKQHRLEQLKEQEQAAKQGDVASYRVSLILMTLAVATLFFGLWQKNIPVLIIGIAVLVVGVQFFRKQQNVKQSKSKAANLRQMLHELRELEQEIVQATVIKDRVHRYDERAQLLQEQRQLKLTQYKNVELMLTQLETELAVNWEELEQFLSRFYISGVTQRKLLPELFSRIREIQQLGIILSSKLSTITTYEQQQEQFIQKASSLTNKMCTKDSIFVHVRNVLHVLEEQKNETNYLNKQLDEYTEQLALVHAEKRIIEEKINELFTVAQVTDEQSFYKADETFKKLVKRKEQLDYVQQQLQVIQLPEAVQMQSDDEIEQQLLQIGKEQQLLQQQMEELLQEQAALQYSTNALLTDEEYGKLLQLFEQQKAELAALVKKWSIQRAVVSSIEQTMHVLREEKLPKVLQLVNKLFYTLTGGQYQDLSINEQGNFEALAKDGMRYHVAELSQATKEQAYVALRFALAQSLTETAPFPFVMDDPFVHFDRNRLNYMIQLMKEVECERQILYFTCHSSIQQQWADANIINLSES